jgi:hypothetical protein
MNKQAEFVGNKHPDLMQAIEAENQKAKKAKAGHWVAGYWERRNGKLSLVLPRFIEEPTK